MYFRSFLVVCVFLILGTFSVPSHIGKVFLRTTLNKRNLLSPSKLFVTLEEFGINHFLNYRKNKKRASALSIKTICNNVFERKQQVVFWAAWNEFSISKPLALPGAEKRLQSRRFIKIINESRWVDNVIVTYW